MKHWPMLAIFLVAPLIVACAAPAAPPTPEALADAIVAALAGDDLDAFLALGPGSGDGELVQSLTPPQEIYDVSGLMEARFVGARRRGDKTDWPALKRGRLIDSAGQDEPGIHRFAFVAREGERFHKCEVVAHETERGLVMTRWSWDRDGGGDTLAMIAERYEEILALAEPDPKDAARIGQAIDAYLAANAEELEILTRRHRAHVEKLPESALMSYAASQLKAIQALAERQRALVAVNPELEPVFDDLKKRVWGK